MQRRLNFLQSGWGPVLGLVLCALLLAGGRAEGAVTQAEKNAWDAAAKSFNEQRWVRAEGEYAKFLVKFPQSDYYAAAVLAEAQARFQLAQEKVINQGTSRQWSFKDVISLLAAHQDQADEKADGFAFWTAEAYYSIPDYAAAADAYAGLISQFTNSTYRAQAIVREADARLQLGQTAQVIQLLSNPDGAFQEVVKTNAADPTVVRGLFLLTQTTLTNGDYAAAAAALAEIPPLKEDLEWKRQYLLCRVNSEGGHGEDALQAATNLLAAAGDDAVFKAESYLMLGDIYRRLERWPEAIAAYATDLGDDAPAEQQRRALLNIVDLHLRRNRLDDAAQALQNFEAKHAEDTNLDVVLLALGELRLKGHFQTPGDTNLLQQAQTNFQQLVLGDTNSPLWGKAQLNLGWCLFAEGKTAESGIAFSNAVARLPHDEDQAVALFKLAETQDALSNYPASIANYGRIINEYDGLASVTNNLFEPALYQLMRANIAQNNFGGASLAARRLLERFPDGLLTQPSMLLLGEREDRSGMAAEARKTFSDFVERWPESKLKPEAELAIARTYERENDWTNAINRLYAWVAANTNHPNLPQAEFQLAWANHMNGNDAQAYSGFTNFLEGFPANQLAAQAWLWIGFYHFRAQEYANAEVGFKGAFGAASPDLRNEARMMAGRAAFARSDFSQATNYFYALATDSNCPLSVQLSAQFAWGDALKASASQTNLFPCQNAINIFRYIATNNPGDPLAPLAWGRMGDCYKLLGAWGDTNQNSYQLATNAYTRVIEATNADLSTRSAAEYGVGDVLEAMARVRAVTDPKRNELFQQAVDHYLNVVNGSNKRDDESDQDMYWVEQTGLAAAAVLSEDLKEPDKALSLYETLRDELPPLQALLKKKIENAQKLVLSQGH